MTIIVESINKFGGEGGTTVSDDFKDIITSFGGGSNIKKIGIKKIEIQSGAAIDGLQFTYNVVTKDGISHAHVGSKYGSNGGVRANLNLADDERIIRINGRYATFEGNVIIRYLEYQTSQKTQRYGENVAYLPFILIIR